MIRWLFEDVPLQSRLSPLWDIIKLAAWVTLLCIPWMILMGCALPFSTAYLDEVAAERARHVCMYAGVMPEHMGDCIQRGVNSRQSTQWFGAWSPL